MVVGRLSDSPALTPSSDDGGSIDLSNETSMDWELVDSVVSIDRRWVKEMIREHLL